MTNRGDAPALVIIGGSNSLLRDGWVDSLKRLHPSPERIVNLSIGAATTAMGLFRLLSSDGLPKDPVIIWEYSLNESNYFTFGQTPELLLRHTSWLFEICARRGYRVLPVILYNQDEADRPDLNLYRQRLAQLLESLGLRPLDANHLRQGDFSSIGIDQLYRDNPHYATDTGFLHALAEKVLATAPEATVPHRDPSGGFAGLNLGIAIPDSVAARPFSNRILSCDMFPLDAGLSVPLRGRLLACYLVSSKTGPAISFRAESDSRGSYSTRISPQENGPPRQLKHLLLWSPAQPPLQADGRLHVTPDDMGGQKPIIQHTMAWTGVQDGTRDVLNGLIGLLVETDE